MKRTDDDLSTGGGDLFDREQLRDYFRFTVGSVRRRRWLVAAVWSSVVALTIAAIWALPRTYHVETKLLAQRSQVLVARGDGPNAVAPTRGAVETVLRRDNLVALIQATDLVEHYRAHRAPAQRLIDGVARLFRGGDEPEQDQLDAMVELLQKRLVGWTSDGTVSIAIDWPDAKMACRLVDAAQQSFIETRYAAEITALSESIDIVRSHAASLTGDIDDAVAAIEKLRAARQGPAPEGAAGVAPVGPRFALPRLALRGAPGASPELVQLKLSLDAKQRAVDDLEGARRHRLSEIQTRLVEQRGTYTENHPVIVDLEQSSAALAVPSIQVKALLQEVAGLREEYDRKSASAKTEPGADGAPVFAAFAPGAAPPPVPNEIARLDSELREDRDPAAVNARGQLRDAMDKYATLRTQLQASQIDLETAQAAFKYRYSILTPAQLPKRPAKPNVPMLLLASFVAALFAAIFVAVVADVRGGRLVERWQIERLLDRPILGEMVLPHLPTEDAE